MTARTHPVYRAFVALYPTTFRRRYGDDLVQHFDDLVVDRGLARAAARTGLDLLITVPTYRLERLVNAHPTATPLGVVIVLVIAGGVAGLFVGAGAAIAVLAAAVVYAVAQRTPLAMAVRSPVADLRRRRLRTSAVLAVAFVVSFGTYYVVIGDTWTQRETILAVVGTAALLGAVPFFVAGLLTPRPPATAS